MDVVNNMEDSTVEKVVRMSESSGMYCIAIDVSRPPP
jgi:hypothetical protein